MIEPHELKNKQFSRVMRGYSTTEVDEHMEFVLAEYTKLYRENDELSRKLSEAEAMLEAYKKDEESIRSALMSAQRASARIINDANDRADELLRASKIDCEKVLAEFRVEIGTERRKLTALKKAITDYKARVYSQYIKHVEVLEKISPDYDISELDLSEEEIAASDEGYVRRVLEDVKADLAASAAQREAENERRMAESRNGVDEALGEIDSIGDDSEVSYNDSVSDIAEPTVPESPVAEVISEDVEAAAEPVVETVTEVTETVAEYVSDTVENAADVYNDAADTAVEIAAEAGADIDGFPDISELNDVADLSDIGEGGEAATDAEDSGIDLGAIAIDFEDNKDNTDNINIDIDLGDAKDDPKSDTKKEGKVDAGGVKAAIEELNRKFRGESSDIDKEYEEALKKLNEIDD